MFLWKITEDFIDIFSFYGVDLNFVIGYGVVIFHNDSDGDGESDNDKDIIKVKSDQFSMDLEEGKFSRKWYPNGPVNKAKWDTSGGGRRMGPTIPPMRRGVTNYLEGGSASRTAPLDWFSTFKSGGKVDQIIKKYMGMKLNVPTGYTFLTSETYRTRGVSD